MIMMADHDTASHACLIEDIPEYTHICLDVDEMRVHSGKVQGKRYFRTLF